MHYQTNITLTKTTYESFDEAAASRWEPLSLDRIKLLAELDWSLIDCAAWVQHAILNCHYSDLQIRNSECAEWEDKKAPHVFNTKMYYRLKREVYDVIANRQNTEDNSVIKIPAYYDKDTAMWTIDTKELPNVCRASDSLAKVFLHSAASIWGYIGTVYETQNAHRVLVNCKGAMRIDPAEVEDEEYPWEDDMTDLVYPQEVWFDRKAVQ